MQRFFLYLVCFVCGLFSLHAGLRGRADLAPAFLAVDLLKSGKTERTLYMKGVKADLGLQLYKGICCKPSLIYAQGSGQLVTGTIGVGHYTPINKRFVVFPGIGISWSYLKTHIDFEEIGFFHLKERFRSSSPFVGVEFYYYFTDDFSLIGLYQYAWSRTHTKIKPFVSETSHSVGPNYGLMLDYRFHSSFSCTLGVGYNITLSKEKHGLRGKGIKLGLAYSF